MAIEGPLRDLGIHDVFQLLDLSRKTGVLRVTSRVRDNEGLVVFDRGKVVHAEIRSNPHPLGQLLLRAGAVTEADLVRALARQRERGDGCRLGALLVERGAVTPEALATQVRAQVEAVVFELMSWREGHFAFEEGTAPVPTDIAVRIAPEALLMEAARRIDEWARIADTVPSALVVPRLAAVDPATAGPLALLPSEWEVVALVDGVRDLRAIARLVLRSEFDIARVVYGLVTTGVVMVASQAGAAAPDAAAGAVAAAVRAGRAAVAAGDLAAAEQAWTRALELGSGPGGAVGVLAGVREAVLALRALHEAMEAMADG
jgi:hypothetical protein